MHKRPIPKRKIKQTLNKALFLAFVFLITLCFLLLCYFFLSLKKRIVISPISIIKNASKGYLNTTAQSSLLEELGKQNIVVKETISASDSSTMVIIDGGEEVVFSQNKELLKQIASLQLIMRQLTIEGRRFKRIDFRFDNPVITY